MLKGSQLIRALGSDRDEKGWERR